LNRLRNATAKKLLNDYAPTLQDTYTAFAPANIALCKYWGKRDNQLNLPNNDSLSISLGKKGTSTTIKSIDAKYKDQLYLNNHKVEETSNFYRRVIKHIDLFRSLYGPQSFEIKTTNTIATAAGLASSSSGFAALTLALSGIYGLNLPSSILSILARLGSGSACRSVFNGFVYWHQGNESHGYDSYATKLPDTWTNLCIGVINISSENKGISSRDGMQQTIETCQLYKQWPIQAAQDIKLLKQAIREKDFILLGSTAEKNAMTMHATMLASWPPLFYWTPDSTETIHKVWQARKDGLSIYITMDAGPNVKLLFEKQSINDVKNLFPSIDIIHPFYN